MLSIALCTYIYMWNCHREFIIFIIMPIYLCLLRHHSHHQFCSFPPLSSFFFSMSSICIVLTGLHARWCTHHFSQLLPVFNHNFKGLFTYAGYELRSCLSWARTSGGWFSKSFIFTPICPTTTHSSSCTSQSCWGHVLHNIYHSHWAPCLSFCTWLIANFHSSRSIRWEQTWRHGTTGESPLSIVSMLYCISMDNSPSV
jgi:hypothetical protein